MITEMPEDSGVHDGQPGTPWWEEGVMVEENFLVLLFLFDSWLFLCSWIEVALCFLTSL
jgi:hypothetical protein